MAGRIAGIYADWSMKFLDAGNEVGTAGGSAAVIDDTNFEAQGDLWTDFKAATLALVLGDLFYDRYTNIVEGVATLPTNGANRETKLLVQYQGLTSGRRYTLTIPTLNPTIPVYINNVNAKDVVLMNTPASITTFVSAFNAFVVAPDVPLALVGTIGQAIQVVGIKVVGRNI